ncbi:MAG: hypothetical protein ACXWUP_10695 [Allosphingosinicella sp.]
MTATIQPLGAAEAALRAYLVRETAISVLINVAISAFMTWLLFGGANVAARGDVLVDFVPQTFIVALMGSLVPGAIARRQVRRGAIPRRHVPPSRPRSLILRSLIAALAATLIFGALGTVLVLALFDESVPFAQLMMLKCGYGGLVALVVTPFAVRLAFGDA